MMNGWGYNHMGGAAWVLMVLLMIVFWVVVVVAVGYFIRRSHSNPSASVLPSPSPDTPEQILRARFARDEIEEAEFRTRMAALKDHQ